MVRASCWMVAFLLCGSLAACSKATSGQDGIAGGSGGVMTSGGTASAGGSIATGGAISEGGSVATGGAIGAGGSIATGGRLGAGGYISHGGIGGQGGLIGTGGAGGGGGTVAQGGSTGSTTIPPIDLTCNTDDDCCVSSDTCRSVVVLYSKLQGLVYWPPATTTGCLRCYTPVVEVSCKNNQCTGTVIDPSGYSGVTGVESHCGKIQGTGGATSQGTGGATSLQAKVDIKASPAPLPPADVPPMFGCGV